MEVDITMVVIVKSAVRLTLCLLLLLSRHTRKVAYLLVVPEKENPKSLFFLQEYWKRKNPRLLQSMAQFLRHNKAIWWCFWKSQKIVLYRNVYQQILQSASYSTPIMTGNVPIMSGKVTTP